MQWRRDDSAQYLPTGHLVFARAGALYAMPFDAAAARRHRRAGQGRRRSRHASRERRRASRDLRQRNAGLCGGRFQDRRATVAVGRPQRRRAASHRSAGIVLVAARLSRWAAHRRRHRRGVLEGLGAGRRARHVHARQPARRRSGSRRVDARRRARNVRRDTTGSGAVRLFSDRFDGTGSATLLFDGAESPTPLGWSPDGRKLLYRQIGATTGSGRVALLRSTIERRRRSCRACERDVGLVLAGRPLGRVRVRRIGAGRGLRSTGARTRPQPGFGRRRHGPGMVARRARAVLRARATPCSLRPSRSAKHSAAARCGVCSRGRTLSMRSRVNYDVAPDGQRFLVPGNQAARLLISSSWC